MLNIDDRLIEQTTPDEIYFLLLLASRIKHSSQTKVIISTSELCKMMNKSKPFVLSIKKSLIEKRLLGTTLQKAENNGFSASSYVIETPYIGVYVTAKGVEFSSKNEDTLVNENDKGSKQNLQGVVNENDKGGQRNLLPLVNDVDPYYINNSKLTDKLTNTSFSKNSDEFSESAIEEKFEVEKTASKRKKKTTAPAPRKERAKTWIDLAMDKFNERCHIEAKARGEEFVSHTFPNFGKEAGHLGKLRSNCILPIFQEITHADDSAIMSDEIFLSYFDAYVLKAYRYFASIASSQGGQNNISFVSMINKYDQIKQTISKVKKKSESTPLPENYEGEVAAAAAGTKYKGFTVH